MTSAKESANRLREILKELSDYGFGSSDTVSFGTIREHINYIDPPGPKLPDGFEIKEGNKTGWPIVINVPWEDSLFSIDEAKAIVYHLNKAIKERSL